MSRLEHGRVMEVLAGAMELPPAQRTSFLDSTCHGEPDLRREVEDLLECADPAAEAFDAASEQLVRADPEQIGPYTILEPVGEGGMAIVYKAQQHHPVRRTVALKLIKLGMDTRQFVARFEAERQALAMMDHANVARVYDAGSTDTGRPYFVMEYVPGQPILAYCDEHRLGLRERLGLFAVACDAVEHAHRKGIIHRDIKNSNVLVTEVDGEPVPKVIDFGVAKAIQHPLSDRTLHTEHGQLIGTPEYMSPEQAERGTSGDVDTRADVYSLGVLLYELMAGVAPIPSDVLRGVGYEQVRRIIRDTEPPRPSTRLSTLHGADGARIAERRRTALPALLRELRSELEWIPFKAMRKDREQRYRGAAELADDVRNYVAHRPLIAGPETSTYRLRKFVRRYQAAVVAVAAVAMALMIGAVASSILALQLKGKADVARAALAGAEAANADASAVIRFFTDDVVRAARPGVARGREMTVKQALDAAAESIAVIAKDRPLVAAAIQYALAETYGGLGSHDIALKHLDDAITTRRRILGDDDDVTFKMIRFRIQTLNSIGRLDEAWALAREAVDRSNRALGPDHAKTIDIMVIAGSVAEAVGEYDRAESLAREALRRSQSRLGHESDATIDAMKLLAKMLSLRGRNSESVAALEQAVLTCRRLYGDDDPHTLSMLNDLAVVLYKQRKLSEAEPIYREILAQKRHVLGGDHGSTLVTAGNLAALLSEDGRFSEAEVLLREVLASRRRVSGDEHPETLIAVNNLGVLLQRQNKLADAESLLRGALEASRRGPVANHPDTTAVLENLAFVVGKQGKYAEAEPLYHEALGQARRRLGDAHPDTLRALLGLGLMLEESGRLSEAAVAFAELSGLLPSARLEPAMAASWASRHGTCLAKMGRHAEAEPLLRDSYARLVSAGQQTHARTRAVVETLAKVCEHTGRPDEAAALRAELSALHAATRPATQSTTRP